MGEVVDDDDERNDGTLTTAAALTLEDSNNVRRERIDKESLMVSGLCKPGEADERDCQARLA
jgi:hypothetical protein